MRDLASAVSRSDEVRAAVEAFSQEIDECTAKLASLRRAANDRKEADGKELPESDSSATHSVTSFSLQGCQRVQRGASAFSTGFY